MLQNQDTPNGPITTHALDIEHPDGGSLCIILANGGRQAPSVSISVDGQTSYTNRNLDQSTNVIRKAVSASGRTTHVEIGLDGDPAANAEIQVLHLEGSGFKPIIKPNGVVTPFSNFTIGYHNELRDTGEANPRTLKMYDIGFDVDLPRTSYGSAGIDSAIAYVIQIMDTTTCQQIREIRGWRGYPGDGEPGASRGTTHIWTRWDGLDNSGQPAEGQGQYVFRVQAYPAFVPTYPSQKDRGIVPYRADYDIPSSSVSAGTVSTSIWDVIQANNAGIADVTNRHDTTVKSAVGGEQLSLSIFLPASIHLTEAPDDFFENLEADPRSSYVMYPEGWDTTLGPYPYLTDPTDIIRAVDIVAGVDGTSWEDVVLDNLLWGMGIPLSAMIGGACGEDHWGNPVCGDVTARVALPQNEALYLHYFDPFAKGRLIHFELQHKEGFDSYMTTGVCQKDITAVGSPSVTSVVNKSSSGSYVLWDETAQIRGKHLWSLSQPGTPADYRISICRDNGDSYVPFADLTSDWAISWITVWWNAGLKHGAKQSFPIGEWPFNVDSESAAEITPIIVRAVFSDICDISADAVAGTSSVVTGTNRLWVEPPAITGANGEESDTSVVVTVEQSPVSQKVELLGDNLQYYWDRDYLSGGLSGLTGSYLVYWSSSESKIAVNIPANPTAGTYTLSRALQGSSFVSGVSGPVIQVNIVEPIPEITGVSDMIQWRDDAGAEEYYVTVQGDNFDSIDSVSDIVVELDGSVDYLAQAFDLTSSSFRVYFPYSVGTQPGTYNLSFSTTGDSPAFIGDTTFTGFKVKGFTNGAYTVQHAWTRSVPSSCSGKSVSISEIETGTYSVVFNYSGDLTTVTNYRWNELYPDSFCSGFIISADCNTILMCGLIEDIYDDEPDSSALNMLHYYDETGEWVNESLAYGVDPGLYQNELYFMAVGPGGKSAVVSTPMSSGPYDVSLTAYRFGDNEDDYDDVWSYSSIDCHDGEACYDMTSANQTNDRIVSIVVGSYSYVDTGSPVDLRYPL